VGERRRGRERAGERSAALGKIDAPTRSCNMGRPCAIVIASAPPC